MMGSTVPLQGTYHLVSYLFTKFVEPLRFTGTLGTCLFHDGQLRAIPISKEIPGTGHE